MGYRFTAFNMWPEAPEDDVHLPLQDTRKAGMRKFDSKSVPVED